VRLVIADTGPINYLVLIGQIDLLPALFEEVVVPETVRDELADAHAPSAVRTWIASRPPWLQVQPVSPNVAANFLPELHPGESAAIALACTLRADLLLIDDRRGVKAAEAEGLRVTGTLGVLDLGAERGLVHFAEALNRLENTNFRRPQWLLDALLAKHSGQTPG
jgi:predicted nucleic acid-binding protein